MIIEDYDQRVHGEPGRALSARKRAWDEAMARALEKPVVLRKVSRSAIYAAATARKLKVEVRQLRDRDGYVVRAYSG